MKKKRIYSWMVLLAGFVCITVAGTDFARAQEQPRDGQAYANPEQPREAVRTAGTVESAAPARPSNGPDRLGGRMSSTEHLPAAPQVERVIPLDGLQPQPGTPVYR